MVALLGRVPSRGELVRHPSGLELEVLEADARRLKKVKIHQPKPGDEKSVAVSGSDQA
jgi:Mg2+/Co2+ transporter CorC